MNRREALSTVSIIFGGTIIGADAFLSGCAPKKSEQVAGFFTSDQITLLDEIGESILPATPDSPGAKAAKIGEFMEVMVRDCYDQEEQDIFLDGLVDIEKLSDEKFGKSFVELNEYEKNMMLSSLEEESANSGQSTHYYTMFKQLTVFGFVTSEVGATKACRHVDVPGRYDACIPLENGEKAWV